MEAPEIWNKEPDIDRLRAAYELLSADPQRARHEFQSLADQGSLMSLVYLAYIYADGIGTPADLTKAEELYRRAYAGGSTTARFRLGRLYWTMKNYKSARDLFEIGAAQRDPRSMYWLARGYLLEKDREHRDRAMQLLKQASSTGHVQSELTLARTMMTGHLGVKSIFCGFWRSIRIAFLGGKLAVFDPKNPALRDSSIDPLAQKNRRMSLR